MSMLGMLSLISNGVLYEFCRFESLVVSMQ